MMTLNTTQISEPDGIRSTSIRDRAKESSKTRNTTHHLVSCGEIEVGFLSLDSRRDLNCLVLYEIFVPRELRHQGIGTQTILQVSRMAKQQEFSAIRVLPLAFENDWPQEELVSWYLSQGFTPIVEDSRELEMRL